MNNNIKRAMYRLNKFSMIPPPVTTVHWTEDDWIKYIDNNGRWDNLKFCDPAAAATDRLINRGELEQGCSDGITPQGGILESEFEDFELNKIAEEMINPRQTPPSFH